MNELGDINNKVLEFEKKNSFRSKICVKLTHQFFHDASILVSVGVFLMHRYATVGIFAHFLYVKNALYLELWEKKIF